VFEIADNVAGLFICDVMGHGVRAALVASILRAFVDALKPFWNRPSVFMTELNCALTRTLRNSHSSLFASAFYAVVDLDKGCVISANAGHPWPLRLRAGCSPQPLRGTENGKNDPALGLLDEATYGECHTDIAGPETILLFTDGIFEVESPDGTLYDYHALCAALGDLADVQGSTLCESVIRKVRQFSGRTEFADDVCLVAMEINRLSAPAVPKEMAVV
jgi:sigma-B regulation protein RsbU (phosphoserine phosphatase)